ncbi:MAG TPA: DUF3788 family protein [Candidatus Goldiibacteriota bacterium]|nr:DUF3788 family protein [Candidatus Goldiibacteriota bacterium]HPI02495.1 DUF3788 family protein [Candidatus Goldiibacteriota bacterium]HPN64829.1 DUF3788 family protein [Candidatus Goldiibacteriota bacterium]HRQ44588.1 DUF3788 family protein [Candidatus Goldiibacteriota bacterium]
METINNIELKDEKTYPDEKVLQGILGKSYIAYSSLIELFNNNEMIHEWRYYRDGKAWLCKVQKKKRTIVWMSAWKGYMKATVYIPKKYLRQIYKLDISDKAKDKIRLTKNVGKSKPCIFEIRDKKILKDFEKVMLLKIELTAAG